MHIRYSAWTGTTEPFASDVTAQGLLDEMADDLLDGGDVSAALQRLLRGGMSGRAGLDDLRRRVADARDRELSRMGLDGPAQQLAEALEPILERERAAVDQALGDASDASAADPDARRTSRVTEATPESLLKNRSQMPFESA